MPRRAKLEGQTFGRLTVIAFAGKTPAGGAKWVCRCECGREATPTTNSLRSGNTTSCGCLATERRAKHWHLRSKTPEYQSWSMMRQRCHNPKSPNYPRYGGRGITVCARWARFDDFFEDMGERPSPQHSLDRIDNDGPYSPENCRWADDFTQTNNRRFSQWFEHDGERRPLAEWARRHGLDKGTVNSRLKSGWSIDDALHTPVHR